MCVLVEAIRVEDLTDNDLVELRTQNPHDDVIEQYVSLAFSDDEEQRSIGRWNCVVIINRARFLVAAEMSCDGNKQTEDGIP